jgi:hypothetical protein
VHKADTRPKTSLGRSQLLGHYVHHMFNMVKAEGNLAEDIYLSLCNLYLMYLMERKVIFYSNALLINRYPIISKQMTCNFVG